LSSAGTPFEDSGRATRRCCGDEKKVTLSDLEAGRNTYCSYLRLRRGNSLSLLPQIKPLAFRTRTNKGTPSAMIGSQDHFR
jgi:hypothetical protein